MARFGIIDYLVIAVYVLGVAALGASFYTRKSTSRDLFLGNRSLSWLPVGISVVAADTSAITVMGVPAWGYAHNLELLWMYVAFLLVTPLLIYIFVPFYTSLDLFTAYEYLERRFSLPVRVLASLQFQFLRGVHVAIAIYAPSLTLSIVTGLPLTKCILFIGLITTAYTAFGGMRAVIWTDVIQFSTICFAICFLLIVTLRGIDGGIATAWRIAVDAGRLHLLNLSFDPKETTSFWACITGGMLLTFASLTTDQALLQRLFTTKSKRDCEQSIIFSAVINIPSITCLTLLGTLFFVFYRLHPDRLQGLPTTDAILPFFAVQNLPHGVSALVVAAILAASMAVMSAGINSLATATTVDLYQRLFRPGKSSEHYATFGRFSTAAWGATATFLALFMGRLGELALAYNRVNSFVCGPLLGIFLLGMLTRRTTAAGALAGAGLGTLAVAFVFKTTQWSFFYQAPIGLIVTYAAGFGLSLLMPAPPVAKLKGLVMGLPAIRSTASSPPAGPAA